MSTNLKPMKLFPRNLTARAATVVRGNPVTTRPESAVENSWPGLEFDHRNIDKFFFPGLVFEFHDERGTILREINPKSPAAKHYKAADINKGVYLAYVQGRVVGRTEGSKPTQTIFSFIPPAALENWRFVRDLEPGRIAIALCKQDVYDSVVANLLTLDMVTPLFRKRRDRVERGLVLLFGDRAAYLDSDGVIDPGLMPPGNLTRSMCSPWQFDFTDCGCFFWASNKPDLVSGEDQPLQILNFQRRDRSRDAARQPSDWILKDRGNGENWDSNNTLGHVELIERYEDLKFVISGNEMNEYVPAESPLRTGLLSRKEVIQRLHYLASVEHALCVEYLYAYYSLKLPPGSGPQREPWRAPGRPAKQTSIVARIFTAADEVLSVAIDEMRHFRWVNEMLIDLGQPWVLGRAKKIGLTFPGLKGVEQNFELKALTADQLDWFVRVERTSPVPGDDRTIGGMYTHILRSIEEGREFAKDRQQRDRLAQSVKNIIDEGFEHYRRFQRAKEALTGIPERRYLNVKGAPKSARSRPDAILQETADASYEVLLRALDYVFTQGHEQRGAMLEAARRAMYNIDDACRSLSGRGIGALFTLPQFVTGRSRTAVKSAHDIGTPLRRHFKRLRDSRDPELKQLADRMEGKLGNLTDHIEAAAKGS